MTIDWKGMTHVMLRDELASGLAERDSRIKDLSALGAPKAGRPPKTRIGDAPRGDLDGEGEGDGALQ